ncbi:hypothetical protein [Robertkochia sediminum]|uniref:hypothetical protein n=1 Tax=Robertkochia sediminum TaxID=2785326 RepID=UPI00193449C2|nr:hypothetical protein [Robertkochia sediminum]MBL7474041.1 hypothetical protein [Robertkochia sediminum]
MKRLKKFQPVMIIALILNFLIACSSDQEELFLEDQNTNTEEVDEYIAATIYYEEENGDKHAIVYTTEGDKKVFTNGKKVEETKERAPKPVRLPDHVDNPKHSEIIEDESWTDEEAMDQTTPDAEEEEQATTPPDTTEPDAGTVGSQDLTGLYNIDHWISEFDNAWNAEYSYYLPKADSGSPFDIYMLAYAIDANTTMFKVTGDRKYLDRALEYVEAKIANAQVSSSLPNSSYKDSYLGWCNTDKASWPEDEVSLGEAHGFRMVSSLVRTLHDATDIRAEQSYQQRYEDLLQFMEVHIWEKWESRGMANIYRSRTHMASHWARMGMDLYYITGNSKYQKVYQDFFYANSDSYVSIKPLIEAGSTDTHLLWKSHSSNPNFNDISHANAEVALFFESREIGLNDFTETELNKLIRTFEDKMYKTAGPYPFYLDGSGSQDDNSFNEGWFRLGGHSTSVQKKLQDYYDVRRNTTFNKTLQIAIMARNYALLSNQPLKY